jgi:hypothetical protein
MVVHALARAMGMPRPLVFLAPNVEDTVEAYIAPAPSLVLGRRIAAAPADATSRDAIGRALLRLATGGDRLHRHATASQILAVLVSLCTAVGLEVDIDDDFDWQLATQLGEFLPVRDALTELEEAARTFIDGFEQFDPQGFVRTLAMAEDRAGAVCAGDPEPALDRILGSEVDPSRPRMLIGYLLSDDHLGLRKTLGYHLASTGSTHPPPIRRATGEVRK